MNEKPEKQPTTERYRYVGTHATMTETGAPVAPGDFVDIDPTFPKYAEAIENGILVPASAAREPSSVEVKGGEKS